MFDALTLLQLIAGVGIIALAYLVRGVAGFGSGLIAIPLLALFLPLSTVVPLIVLLDYIASFTQGVSNRSAIRWKEILTLIPFSLVGVALALFVISQASMLLLTKALGVFIILFALYMLSGFTPKADAARGWAAAAGLSGGMIGTLFGTGGPFYVTYFKARGLEKAAFRATFATMFLVDGAARLVGYAGSGLFTLGFLFWVAAALPVMGMFLYIGGHIHTKLTQAQFQRAISVLLLASGSALLLMK